MTDFIELTSSTDGRFITKQESIDIVFYDEEADSVIVVINSSPTVVTETYGEIRNLLL